jgi:hypothetical protein
MLVAIYAPPPPVPLSAALVMRARQQGQPRRLRGVAGLFDTVSSTIQTIEGWFPGSVSYRLNNPGNLLYAGQPGAVPHTITAADGSTHVFAEFQTLQQGQQALDNQIALDASRGLTIAQFTAKYAPAQDSNDPASYAAQIAQAAGLTVNDPLAAAQSAAASIPPPDSGSTPSWIVDVFGQPFASDGASAVDLTPVLWAALAVGGALYVAASS